MLLALDENPTDEERTAWTRLVVDILVMLDRFPLFTQLGTCMMLAPWMADIIARLSRAAYHR